jgi:hypothetical protein
MGPVALMLCIQKSYNRNFFSYLTRPARFERATYGLEIRCSIQLSYGRSFLNSLQYNDFFSMVSNSFTSKIGDAPKCAKKRTLELLIPLFK